MTNLLVFTRNGQVSCPDYYASRPPGMLVPPPGESYHRWSMSTGDGTRRADVKPGQKVRIVQKADQRTGALTEGTVQDILTNSSTHPHGIKVRLSDGRVGRVKEILD